MLAVLLHTAFDPDQFAQMPIEGSNSTERIPIDENEYPAIVDTIKFRPSKGKDGTEYLWLDVNWSIDDQEQREKLGREKVTCRQSLSLDRLENGSLDMGKGRNVDLGKLREAVGLNTPGQPFQFSMLVGCTAKVKIKNRQDGDDTYSDVKGVTAL